MPSKQSFSQRGGTKVTTEEGRKDFRLLIVRFQIYPKVVSFGYFNLKSPIWNLRLPLELSTFSNVSESRSRAERCIVRGAGETGPTLI
jgi:hypothetical protein